MNAKQTPAQRAQQLPALQPGIEIIIPLELLPIYFAAHRIEAMDRTAVSKLEEKIKARREPGVLWVARQEDVR
jgi:hypothetical protein